MWSGQIQPQTKHLHQLLFFLDAVALQFVEGEDQNRGVPFFGMGEQGKPVNIWHWRADAMQQVEHDGKSTVGGEGEVIRLSLDPFRSSSVEELNAEGFGRLSVQSLEDQQVLGRGVWADGRWRVVMIRSLKRRVRVDVQFKETDSMLLALALWDGSDQGQKCVVNAVQPLAIVKDEIGLLPSNQDPGMDANTIRF